MVHFRLFQAGWAKALAGEKKLGITIINHYEKFHGAVSPLRHLEPLQRQGSTKRTAPLNVCLI